MRGTAQPGFTLLELLAALAIVSLLCTLALPAYQEAMRRTLRREARLALLRIQGQQERHFTDHLRYATQLAAPVDAESLGLESFSSSNAYELSLQTDVEGMSYTAIARARGRQSGDYHCAVLTLDYTGQRGAFDAQGNASSDAGRCWN
jgi:type IV pilus assembly protein PilE